MKIKISPTFCYLILVLLDTNLTYAQTDTAVTPEERAINKQSDSSSEEAKGTNAPSERVKTAPNTLAIRMAQLKSQYPKEDYLSLQANNEPFTALWKKDQSGEALGAVLIVPSDGQTANWPNTIDVLRNELPQDGWSTLSIDIESRRSTLPSKSRNSASPETKKTEDTTKDDINIARIESAISFLHEQGQYNIVLAGYGYSTSRILNYASRKDALGMNRTIKSRQRANLKRPVRALILISPFSYGGERLSTQLNQFPYKNMPILDIIFGSHYLDTFDSKERVSAARSSRFKHYVQSKSVEPTGSGRLFGQENRLSRRIRGFLDTYAKGVEIERR